MTNGGLVASTATADANTVGVNLAGTLTAGVAAGGVGIKAITEADAAAYGIEGGLDQDTIVNTGDITATSTADAASTSVGGSINITPTFLSFGASLADLSTTANSLAAGLVGDRGSALIVPEGSPQTSDLASQGDFIDHRSGLVTATSTADASGVSVGLAGFFGGTGFKGDTEARAVSYGAFGGLGTDRIVANGDIDASATATTNGPGVQVVPVGANLTGLESVAGAFAYGLGGGDDYDELVNNGDLSATATADATGDIVNVTLAGANDGNLFTMAEAESYGVDGGLDADAFAVGGTLTTVASADARGSLTNVSVAGASFADLSSIATSRSAAVSGGGGATSLRVDAAIDAQAFSDVSAPGLSFTAGGASFSDELDAGTVAASEASAFRGESGSSSGMVGGNITILSEASADRGGVGGTLVGASLADLAPEATAIGAVVLGSSGTDALTFSGSASVGTKADVDVDGVTVSLVGASLSDLDPIALARSYGLEGGDGNDSLLSEGSITNTALSELSIGAVGVTVGGASVANLNGLSDARSTGIDGGAGRDTLDNRGVLTNISTGVLSNANVSVNLIGAGVDVADASRTNRATSTGLAGGDGADVLRNFGVLTSTGVVGGADVAVTVEVAGAGFVDASAAFEANALGISGGAGGDTVLLDGVITTDSRVDGRNYATSVVLAGASGGNTGTSATARSSGVDGGTDNDIIDVLGTLTGRSEALASALSVNVGGLGALIGDADATTRAITVGVDAGAGDDEVNHLGSFDVRAVARGTSNATQVVIGGAATGDASADVEARAMMVAGGGGNDRLVLETGGLGVATASGRARNVSVTGAGSISGDASNTIDALIQGVVGGSGADTLLIAGNAAFNLDAQASGDVGRVSVGLAGTDSGARLGTDIVARARGASGGTGKDDISNSGTMDIDVASTTNASSTSVVIAGAALIDTGLFATSHAVGLHGDEDFAFLPRIPGRNAKRNDDDDDDIVRNEEEGSIDITSRATITASGSTVNIAGAALTEGLLRARARSAGLAGGGGDDGLVNAGGLAVRSYAVANSSNSNLAIFGAAGGAGDAKALAETFGLHGGAGNDSIISTGSALAHADARSTLSGSSYTFGGYSGAGGAVGADAFSYGAYGDAGDDTFFISGSLAATTYGRTTANSSVDVTFGEANSDTAPLSTLVQSVGVHGGSGADALVNEGRIDATSMGRISTTNTRFAFIGGALGLNSVSARSLGYGFFGGSGNDSVLNDGEIVVVSDAQGTGSGAAGATIGATSSASQITARAFAIGFDGGSGLDSFTNTNLLEVEAHDTTRASNTVSSTAIFSSGRAVSIAGTLAEATGIRDESGNTNIFNTGRIEVSQRAGDSSLNGHSRTDATANGVTVGVGINAQSTSHSVGYALIKGIELGSGSHVVVNNGNIDVRAFTTISARANANGNAGINGLGTATARGDVGYFNSSNNVVQGSQVVGIESMEGSLNFTNTGDLIVKNAPRLSLGAFPNATGLGVTDPDARAFAYGYANNVYAYGVRTGAADDMILNTGQISAESEPEVRRAYASASPSSSSSFGLSVDSFATSVAEANNAYAWGVHAGDGNNMIVNRGTISVVSDPYAEADGRAVGRGPDGDVWASVRADAKNARAYGVVTGSGDDYVENSGTIQVFATPSISRDTSLSVGSFCTLPTPFGCAIRLSGEVDKNTKRGSTSSRRWGILTGDGDDIVYNRRGTINASGAVAIDLGSGDDTLILEGGSISGSVTAGSGSDTLRMIGTGSWNAVGQSFENFVKSGTGTFSLTNTTSQVFVNNEFFDRTQINEGTLQVNGSVRFHPTSETFVTVFGDGSVGKLHATRFLTLDGTLTVQRSGAGFFDGQTFDVISSGIDRISVFDTVNLPEPTALTSFSGAYDADGYVVTAEVAPMATTASFSSSIDKSFAEALDAATPTAEGDVAENIAGLQSLMEITDVAAAVSGLAPTVVTTNLDLASGTMAIDQLTINRRLTAIQGGPAIASALSSPFASQETTRLDGLTRQWRSEFGGSALGTSAFHGFSGDVSGMSGGTDWHTDEGVLGLAMSHVFTDSGQIDGISGASFSALGVSVYGGRKLGEQGYAQFSSTFGLTRTDAVDPLDIVTPDASLDDPNTTRSFGLRFEGGRNLGEADSAPQLYAAVAYRGIAGPALLQSGALSVTGDDSAEALTEAQLGVRMAGQFDAWGSPMIPSLDLALVRREGQGAETTAHFAEMPGEAFTLRHENFNRNAVQARAGLYMEVGDRWQISGSGIAETGDREGAVRGELRAKWVF